MKILWPSNQSSILLAKNLSFLGALELGGVLIQASHMTADTRDNIDW